MGAYIYIYVTGHSVLNQHWSMKNWLQFLWIKAMDRSCYQQQHQTGSRPWLTKTPVPNDPWQSTTHATYTPPRNDLMKREGRNNYEYVAHENLYRYRLSGLIDTKWSFEGWMGRHCRYYSSLHCLAAVHLEVFLSLSYGRKSKQWFQALQGWNNSGFSRS